MPITDYKNKGITDMTETDVETRRLREKLKETLARGGGGDILTIYCNEHYYRAIVDRDGFAVRYWRYRHWNLQGHWRNCGVPRVPIECVRIPESIV